MSKKGWIYFISSELVMIAFVVILMWILGFYKIEIALWRKIVATLLMPIGFSPLIWILGKYQYKPKSGGEANET